MQPRYTLLAFIALFFALQDSTEGRRVPLPEPNIQLSVTDKGLEYVNKALVKALVKQLGGLVVPTVNIKQWGVHLKLSNAKVNTVSVKSASLRINKGMLQLILSLGSLGIRGHYRKYGWFGSNGIFTAKMDDILIVQDLSVGHNSKGKPVIKERRCDTDIIYSKFDFKKSFMLNVAVQLAKTYFKNKVENIICSAVGKAIKEKGKLLPSLYPDGFKLNNRHCKGAEVSYPITRRPAVAKTYLNFLITGKVKSSCHPSGGLTNSPRVSMKRFIPSPDRMISITLSDYFLNSLVNLYFKVGRMTRTFTVSMPQGNSSTNVQIKIQATSSPVIKTTRNGSSMTFTAQATLNGPPSLGKILLLSENLLVASELIFQEEKKKLSLELKNLTIAGLTPSKPLGPGAGSQPSALFQMIQNNLPKVTQSFNQSFRRVVPLPLFDKIQITNEQILHEKGHVILQMDVKI